jgi:hypothetical protein
VLSSTRAPVPTRLFLRVLVGVRRDTGERPASPVTRHSVEQRRLTYRGREYHFVSYDGLPASAKPARPATSPAWWLMGAGTRWEVLPYYRGQPPQELDRLFTEWIEAHVYGSATPGA